MCVCVCARVCACVRVCVLCRYEPSSDAEPGPEKFYEKVGFVETGRVVGDEREMRFEL